MSPRLAYMTGEYPRATDTFIQREVAALRALGLGVDTISIRRTADEHMVGPEQREERGRTFYVTAQRPAAILAAHARALARSPRRYGRALGTALRVRSPGLRSLVHQACYFVEAGIIADRLRRRGVAHLHNHAPDSSGTVAMLAAEIAGITFSFTLHGPSIFFEPHRWRLPDKLRRARFVICISRFARSQAMIWTPPERWDRLHFVHCGVDPSPVRPREHRGRGRRVLFVGRLAPEKGLPALLEALAALRESHPDVTLDLIGDGPERGRLETLASTLGVEEQVRFHGYRSQAEVRGMMANADVFALASFAEGVPVVLMEAMAAGLPVVATRIAGIPELVEHGRAGWLVPPGDPAALGAAIGRLLDDPDERSRYGRAGREMVERQFDVRREAERLAGIFAEALGEAPASPRAGPEPAAPGRAMEAVRA